MCIIKEFKACVERRLFSPYGGQGITKLTSTGKLKVTNDDGYIFMEKWCAGCEEWLAYDNELWTLRFQKTFGLSIGLTSKCKGCQSKIKAEKKRIAQHVAIGLMGLAVQGVKQSAIQPHQN